MAPEEVNEADEWLEKRQARLREEFRDHLIETHQCKRFFVCRVLPLPIGVLCLSLDLSGGVIAAAVAYAALGLVMSPEPEKFAYELFVGVAIAFGVLVGSSYLLPEIGLAGSGKMQQISSFIDDVALWNAAAGNAGEGAAGLFWGSVLPTFAALVATSILLVGAVETTAMGVGLALETASLHDDNFRRIFDPED